MTILLFFDLRKPRPINFSSWSTSVWSSGIMAASAPEAIALFCARKPASRPITSTKKIRSCEVAVSRILSTQSTIVFKAVSYPIVESVPYKSLSIVPGKPMQGTSNSLANICAPLNEPFPPITTNASIPAATILSYATLRPSGVIKSFERAVFKIVPPRWIMLLTS